MRAKRSANKEEVKEATCGGGSAEALAKESLNYKTTDVDDRPKNLGGRGGLSICLAPRLVIAACFFNVKCPSSWRSMKGRGDRSIRLNET